MPQTKVKGVTYNNSDGTSRQTIISRLTLSSPISLKRDYANLYDPNAVMVVTEAGDQIGFLDRDMAGRISVAMDRGEQPRVSILRIAGGSDGFFYGIEVLVDG